jgi:tRNA (cytidine32/uridine32-2'-O)-methyltransferase
MCVLSWSIPPPANIGSALTRHENDGTLKLVLVAPKTYPHPDIDALAAGAQDLIEKIEIVETLEQAIQDCHLVFGTSARSRTIPWPCWTYALQLKSKQQWSTKHRCYCFWS